jgi:superoxide dismutase, Fe-Mn family
MDNLTSNRSNVLTAGLVLRASATADHTMFLAGATPILALDMSEHAYAMDYSTKATAYMDAYLATVNWTAADRQFTKAAA